MKYVKYDDEYEFYRNDGDKMWDAYDGSPYRGILKFLGRLSSEFD